ncbi:hypothetical protein KKF91_21605 [Myxococcota bacterium]|nr:hypothetical protein [Myxococcota bacterium]MBU1433142.1 hypothetical protein [Myxococcota bacterium]
MLALLLLCGCQPELPGRGCATSQDCFRGEVCLARTCVEVDTRADAAVHDDAGMPDAAPDATPDAAPDAATPDATPDAAAPDATPDSGALIDQGPLDAAPSQDSAPSIDSATP